MATTLTARAVCGAGTLCAVAVVNALAGWLIAAMGDRHHTHPMTNVVLVHGGFIGGWYWSEVAQRLEKAGHRVEVMASMPDELADVLGRIH